MSKEYVLLSLSEYQRLKSSQPPPQQMLGDVEARNSEDTSQAKLDIIQDGTPPSDSYDIMVELMPKSYKSRARSLLRILRPRLTSQGRLIYGDDTQGSHIVDLLKYVLSPVQFRHQAPTDIKKFADLLRQADVPQSLYKLGAVEDGVSVSKWLTFQ